ncbi:hypothetical protein V490_02368 [Pseudogymnoascus sp. VKM F-3557]|nr:hypothetical protein V490_02368 [Pseudogymnoascus sp. VKM F-3557]
MRRTVPTGWRGDMTYATATKQQKGWVTDPQLRLFVLCSTVVSEFPRRGWDLYSSSLHVRPIRSPFFSPTATNKQQVAPHRLHPNIKLSLSTASVPTRRPGAPIGSVSNPSPSSAPAFKRPRFPTMHFSKSLVALAACFLPLIASAELKLRNADAKNVKANSYIVVYNDIDDSTFESEMFGVHSFLSRRDSTFRGMGHKYKMPTFKGYQIEADMDTVNKISESSHVAYVEKDVMVSAYELSVRIGAPWGLDRISHRNGTSEGKEEYRYDSSAGEGTTIYVVDSGINIKHEEFGGRAVWGKNYVEGSIDEDEDGHGTHVAGIAGGANYGVASKAHLIAIKVLDAKGDGTSSDVLAGMQWAADDAEKKNQTGKSVINMSLGAGYSEAFNKATAAIIARGVVVVAAAGNEDANASGVSPASTPDVITVGATYRNDTRATFSNWGVAIDVFAPGVGIKSAWKGSTNATMTISGTSMACPHVAGLAAYFIGLEKNGTSTPAKITARIKGAATRGVVTDLKNSVNNLVYNDDGY